MGRLLAQCSGAILRGVLGALVAVVAVVGLPADPAAADPPAPTDVRSRVETIVPPVAGVTAEIVGGDSFLRLRVDRGREVIVAGYEGEPYLRFRPDGTVEVNRRSPAATVNESRFGTEPGPGADSDATPEWEPVAEGGAYAWHDHRTHWMAATRPDPPERAWAVPIRVDGRRAEITGSYRYEAPPAAWPWLVAGAVAAAALVAAVRRWPRLAVAVGAACGVGIAVYGLVLGRLPGGSGGPGTVTLVLGVIAVAGAVGAAVVPPELRGPLLAGGGVALVVAGWRHVDVFTHSVLTTSWPPAMERALVTVALAGGAVAVVAGVAQTFGVYQPSGTSASASGGPHDPRG